jgi:hypothetical protein
MFSAQDGVMQNSHRRETTSNDLNVKFESKFKDMQKYHSSDFLSNEEYNELKVKHN